MFRTSLFSGTMLAVAHGIAITQPELNSSQALTLAQTGNGCCCSYMPCMPTCNQQCNDYPEPSPTLPPAIQNIELNLDVILTHILHEVHPDIPVIPGTDEEHEFVHNSLTPIVIELINNDIGPAIPTCHFPDGSTTGPGLSSDETPAEGEAAEPVAEVDRFAVIRTAMADAMSDVDLPGNMTLDDLLDTTLQEHDIVSEINIESEDGQNTLTMVIQGLRQHVHEAFEHTGVATAAQDAAADAAIDNVEQALQDNSDGLFPVSEEVKAEEAVEDEAVEQATDLLIDGLEDAGNDTQGLEGDIQSIVEDAASNE